MCGKTSPKIRCSNLLLAKRVSIDGRGVVERAASNLLSTSLHNTDPRQGASTRGGCPPARRHWLTKLAQSPPCEEPPVAVDCRKAILYLGPSSGCFQTRRCRNAPQFPGAVASTETSPGRGGTTGSSTTAIRQRPCPAVLCWQHDTCSVVARLHRCGFLVAPSLNLTTVPSSGHQF